MSLILDALRKSEAERRRGALPALDLELPPPPASRRKPPAWLAWLALPLLAGAALAGWWILQDDPPPPVEPVRAPQRAEPADPLPAVALPAPEPVPAAPAAASPAATPPPTPVPALPAPSTPAPASAPSPGSLGDGVAPRGLANLSPDVRRALPPLRLTMHVWAEDPAARFVILDGQRLGEGGRAGPAVIDTIAPDGVILAVDGDRIHLPLP